jgi:hypothetical protein
MLRVLTIAAFAVALATGVPASARADAWRAIAVSGDVRVEGAAAVLTIGATFQSDVVIQTGASGQATFEREGRSIVLGPNARVHLAYDDATVSVESGSAVLHRPGVAKSETVTAGGSADLSVAVSRDVAPTNTSEASESNGNGHSRLPPLSSLGALRASPQRAASPPAASYVAMPAARSGVDEHGSSTITDAGLAPRAPSITGGEPAPTLRFSPARDVDLPATAVSGGTRFQFGSDGTGPTFTRKTGGQQLEALHGAWSDASSHVVPGLDRHGAETLLRKFRPDTDADRAWTERPKEIAKIAAIVMTGLVGALLAVMGLVALWRALRRTKPGQPQPRWTTI